MVYHCRLSNSNDSKLRSLRCKSSRLKDRKKKQKKLLISCDSSSWYLPCLNEISSLCKSHRAEIDRQRAQLAEIERKEAETRFVTKYDWNDRNRKFCSVAKRSLKSPSCKKNTKKICAMSIRRWRIAPGRRLVGGIIAHLVHWNACCYPVGYVDGAIATSTGWHQAAGRGHHHVFLIVCSCGLIKAICSGFNLNYYDWLRKTVQGELTRTGF